MPEIPYSTWLHINLYAWSWRMVNTRAINARCAVINACHAVIYALLAATPIFDALKTLLFSVNKTLTTRYSWSASGTRLYKLIIWRKKTPSFFLKYGLRTAKHSQNCKKCCRVCAWCKHAVHIINVGTWSYRNGQPSDPSFIQSWRERSVCKVTLRYCIEGALLIKNRVLLHQI